MSNRNGTKSAATSPGRAIGRGYLAILADACPLEAWREICLQTVAQAKTGDAKARDWLACYLMSESPLTLDELAADELAGFTASDALAAQARARQEDRQWFGD